MQVACPSCGHVLTVPPERAAVPNLRAKCRCGHVFPVAGNGGRWRRRPGRAAAARPAARLRPLSEGGPGRDRSRRGDPRRERAGRAGLAAVMTAAAAGASVLKPPPLPQRPGAAVPKPRRPWPPRRRRRRSARPTSRLGRKPRTVPVPWRRCQNHPQVRSEHVCPKCTKGFCDTCAQKVQTAAICLACEGLCVAAAAYEEIQDRAKQRDRSMMEEIPVIVGYPLRDPLAYVLLALFTWFFGLFAGFAFIMAVLSKGVLTWYSFNAVSKVSIGNLRDVMPEFRDLSDIAHAMRLSLAALAISAGPLFLCLVLIPGADLLMRSHSAMEAPRLPAVHAQPPSAPAAEEEADEAGESGSEGERASALRGGPGRRDPSPVRWPCWASWWPRCG